MSISLLSLRSSSILFSIFLFLPHISRSLCQGFCVFIDLPKSLFLSHTRVRMCVRGWVFVGDSVKEKETERNPNGLSIRWDLSVTWLRLFCQSIESSAREGASSKILQQTSSASIKTDNFGSKGALAERQIKDPKNRVGCLKKKFPGSYFQMKQKQPNFSKTGTSDSSSRFVNKRKWKPKNEIENSGKDQRMPKRLISLIRKPTLNKLRQNAILFSIEMFSRSF